MCCRRVCCHTVIQCQCCLVLCVDVSVLQVSLLSHSDSVSVLSGVVCRRECIAGESVVTQCQCCLVLCVDVSVLQASLLSHSDSV